MPPTHSGELPPPSIAAICLAHCGNPAGAQRLAAFFAKAGAWLYLHVDARVPIEPYARALADSPNVTLLDDRRAIHWGGSSLVETEIQALRTAMAHADHTRFCLVSEDSAPLVPPALFRRLMAEDREFIQLDPCPEGPVLGRYAGFYYFDSAATNPRSTVDARIVEPHLAAQLARLEALRVRGKYPLAQLFHGPSWWGLSRQAAARVLAEHDGNAHLRESFVFSQHPDEQFIHTILGNAHPRCSTAPFMHADFTRDPRPYVFTTGEELSALQSMPFVFARKVCLHSTAIDAFFRRIMAEPPV